jgi:hypothetical protein
MPHKSVALPNIAQYTWRSQINPARIDIALSQGISPHLRIRVRGVSVFMNGN